MTMNCILFTIRDSGRRSLYAASGLLNASSSSSVSFNSSYNCSNYHHHHQDNNNVSGIFKRLLSTSSSSSFPLIKCNDQSGSKFSVRNLSSSSKTGGSESQLEFLKQVKKRRGLMEEPNEEETGAHVIYQGLLTGQMRRLKVFSLTTSVMGLAMQPMMIQKSAEVATAGIIAMFGVVGFFTIGTPLLIHAIAKKYVTEIVYDPDKDSYKATTFTFFLQKRETVFKMEDIKVPDVPGPFTTMLVNKDKPLFVAPESFLKPEHYGRFMGYDKPIDYRLRTVDNSSSESETKSKSSAEANK